ncbi:hypothetical protein [Nostoc sp.]|uniref:hypothetical protein n=1 Tax=Nostoc sp. TaxID=1180 RepID=UPI002A66BEC4|nr:hypothetical protein [Nostoc sp. S13]
MIATDGLLKQYSSVKQFFPYPSSLSAAPVATTGGTPQRTGFSAPLRFVKQNDFDKEC